MDPRARIIVFGERIEQADALYEQLAQLYPNQAARYHSEVDKEARRLALERYRHGEIRILVSCRALDEGFDVPSANVGIILSSSAVERQRIQRLGRILRRCEGKELASLYYLYVAESVEETAYFVDLPAGTGVCDLSFDTQSGAFLHPSYEAAANAVLAALKRKGAAPALLTEAERCISLGVVRPDWLMNEAYCAQELSAAKTTSQRNYWICMRQMAAYRKDSAPK